MHERRESSEVPRIAFIWSAIAVGVAVTVFALWKAAAAFLLIFGGILLAAAFDSLARLFGRLLPVGRRWRIGLAVLLVALVLGVATFFGARALVSQFAELTSVIEQQMGRLQERLADIGLVSGDSEDGLTGLLPDGTSIFGGATQAVLALFGGVGNFVLLVFLGIFFALEPHLYKRGFVSLFPPRHRPQLSHILHEGGETLRLWLIGQSISMGLVFLVSLVVLLLIQMPFAVLLAVQAGLLAFIPLLGPVLAGVPIILAGFSQSPEMAMWGVGAYLLIQGVESYTIQPLVQERTVNLPPALTLSLQLVLGVLFGLLGVALAVPLGATLRTVIEIGYVRNMLGGAWEGDRVPDR